MRKKLLLAFAFVFTFVFANAQQREAGDIEIVPKMGYSLYFLNGDDSDLYGPVGGMRFGAEGDYYFNENWSLRSGLVYLRAGATLDLLGLEVKEKYDYLNIPINVNFHFGQNKNWNVNFGLTPGFLVSAKAESKGNFLGIPVEEEEEDISSTINPFHLGISYGIGYKYQVSESFGLLFDVQNMFGITNINDDDESPDDENFNAGGSFNIGGVFTF